MRPPDMLPLREARRRAGLSQEQLGALAEVNSCSISRWESANQWPSRRRPLAAVLRALGLSPRVEIGREVDESGTTILFNDDTHDFCPRGTPVPGPAVVPHPAQSPAEGAA